MSVHVTLLVVRGIFLLCCAGLGILIGERLDSGNGWAVAWTVPVGLLAGLIIIGVEMRFARSSIQTISAIVFGLLAGFAASALFSPIIEVIVERVAVGIHVGDAETAAIVRQFKFLLQMVATVLFCFFGVTILLQTQGQFKFLIPYVEFRSEVKGLRPIFADTSVILEGQLGPLAEVGFFESRLVVPSFVAREIQGLADSSDSRKRQLGERGLAILKSLVDRRLVEVVTYDDGAPIAVDELLVRTAHREGARVLTRDRKLDGRAQLEGVSTIFLPRVIEAIRPHHDVGDTVEVEIVRRGEEEQQGVGYLPDGTLIVVDQAQSEIGKVCAVEIRRVVPTAGGRILFARRVAGPRQNAGTGSGGERVSGGGS